MESDHPHAHVKHNADGELLDECGKTLWQHLANAFPVPPANAQQHQMVQQLDDVPVVAMREKVPYTKVAPYDQKAEMTQLAVDYFLGKELPYYVAYVMSTNFHELFQYRFNIADEPFVLDMDKEKMRDGAEFWKAITKYLPTYAKNSVVQPRMFKIKDRSPAWYTNCQVSCATLKGKRKYQEDRYICLPSLELHSKVLTKDVALLAVLDGHNGPQIASYACAHMPFELVRAIEQSPDNIEKATENMMIAIDERCIEKTLVEGWKPIGSTATVAVLDEKNIYLRWLGDSPAYLLSEGKCERLNTLHTTMPTVDQATYEAERKRAEDEGGYYAFGNGEFRLNGSLSITRAFGDLAVRPALSGVSDSKTIERSPDQYLLLLMSDGVSDIYKPAQMFTAIESFVQENDIEEYADLAEHIVRTCVDKMASMDNCTIVIAFLRPPKDLWALFGQKGSSSSSSSSEVLSSSPPTTEE